MRYRFNGFVIDLHRRVLTRRGGETTIGDRAFSVLAELVTNAGRLRTKRELLDTVWDDVVVGEDNLTKAIGEIRAALGDSPAEARFVRTVHRRGYVFVAAVTPLEDDDQAAASSAPATHPEAGHAEAEWRRWLAPMMIAVGLAAMATWIALSIADNRDATAQDHSHPFVGWSMRQVERVPKGVFKPSFSPVGDAMVAVTSNHASGVHSLVLINPDLEDPMQLTDDLEVRGPSPLFSANGRDVWFTTFHHHTDHGLQPRVMKVPAVGGDPRVLVENASAASPSPDGRSMAFSQVTAEGTSICVSDEDGTVRTVADPGYWPRFSPDGRWIAYTTSNPEGGNGLVWVVQPDGSHRRKLNTISSQVYGLCWTADSRFVVYACDVDGTMDLWISAIDDPRPSPVTRSPGACTAPAISRDGSRLVFAFALVDVALHIADSLDETLETLLDVRGIAGAAISPGGDRIALAATPDSAAPPVSVLHIASGRRHAISGLRCEQIRWAPGEEFLVAAAPSPDGSAMWIWRIPADGGAASPLTTGPGRWAWPDLSPDGSRLAAARWTGDDWQIEVRNLTTGKVEVVASTPDAQGLRWSPDGSMLAWSGGYRPADASSSGVWVVSIEDGTVIRIAADGAWPAWEPAGRSLVYVGFLDRAGLWRVQVAGGSPQPLQEFTGKLSSYLIEGIDLGRDGAPLLVLTKASKPALFSLQPLKPGFSE